MKKIASRLPFIFALLLIFLLMLSAGAAASQDYQKVTIIGEVNDESQIVASDGTVYEIAFTGKGIAVARLIAAVIEVTGFVVEEEGGIKILHIEFYRIVEQI
jgi:hypothetical protein